MLQWLTVDLVLLEVTQKASSPTWICSDPPSPEMQYPIASVFSSQNGSNIPFALVKGKKETSARPWWMVVPGTTGDVCSLFRAPGIRVAVGLRLLLRRADANLAPCGWEEGAKRNQVQVGSVPVPFCGWEPGGGMRSGIQGEVFACPRYSYGNIRRKFSTTSIPLLSVRTCTCCTMYS